MTLVRHLTHEDFTDKKPTVTRPLKLKNEVTNQLQFFISRPAFTCSKLTIETVEQWRRSGIFIVNFEHVSHLVLVFLLLTSNM